MALRFCHFVRAKSPPTTTLHTQYKQISLYTTPTMSSLRNAVQRRNHKERAQPTERKKWGLLEKHKDYSLRAADHNAKKLKLKTLQQKASERNEDEFYFGMMSSSTDRGVKRARRGEENSGGGKVLAVETVRLMKTQDEGYLRTVLQSTRRLRGRVEEEVVAGETGVRVALPAAGKKIVFGEDGEDLPVVPAPAVEDDDAFDDPPSDLEDLNPGQIAQETNSPSREELKLRKLRQLEGLKDREEQLTDALREVELQRARMSGTTGGRNKNGVKFKQRQRKR